MRVLVTGAGGFLGSHLAERLIADGHAVRALVRPTNVPRSVQQSGAEVVIGDLTDPEVQTTATRDCDVVFHVAGLVTEVNVPDSEYFRVNSLGSEGLARRAAEGGAKRFVLISSTAVHRPNSGRSLDEQTALEPEEVYGRSKVEAERRVAAVAADTGLELVVVRPSRVYGPRDASLGRVFRAIARRRFLLVGRCDAEVDFVYVSDVVEALARVAARGSGIYLVGGPERLRLDRFFAEIASAVGVRLPAARLPLGPALLASWIVAALWKAAGKEPPIAPKRFAFFRSSRVVDSSRASRELGYEPRVLLPEGVRRTAEWYRQAGWL